MKIEVEESALDAIAAMGKRLQEERDELLEMLQKFDHAARVSQDVLQFSQMCDRFVMESRELIAKCTAEPDILEGKQ